MTATRCPACQRPDAEEWPSNDRTTNTCVSCKSCGDFRITREAKSDLYCGDTGDLSRRKLARYLYETREDGERLVSRGKVADADEFARAIELGSVAKLYKDDGSALEKYENTIRNIAAKSGSFGQRFVCREDRWLFPTMDDLEASHIRIELAREGYLLEEASNFSLTPKGLQYATELSAKAKASGTSVFVAACFSAELDEARQTISMLLAELGYQPRLVNREPHNNLIDLEIYRLIRESRFVVADLTCNRPSVYYEVGFAHGLGLEVVLTCHADHLSDAKGTKNELHRVHFDLNHRNILRWEQPADLAESLRGHIYQSFGALQPTIGGTG